MTGFDPFETRFEEYDDWFEENDDAYLRELAAIEQALEDVPFERALEIGVGTGRFAGQFGIGYGIDPASNPLELARKRGIEPIRGVGQRLPFQTDAFDLVLFVTTWCFLEDIDRTLQETRRVLNPSGSVIVGFLDSSSPLGETHQETKSESPFYANATLSSGEEVGERLERSGFSVQKRLQSVFDPPGEIPTVPDEETSSPVRDGHGEGLFGIVQATLE